MAYFKLLMPALHTHSILEMQFDFLKSCTGICRFLFDSIHKFIDSLFQFNAFTYAHNCSSKSCTKSHSSLNLTRALILWCETIRFHQLRYPNRTITIIQYFCGGPFWIQHCCFLLFSLLTVRIFLTEFHLRAPINPFSQSVQLGVYYFNAYNLMHYPTPDLQIT